jgi:hypothetical protein
MNHPSYESIPIENWLISAPKSAPGVRAVDGSNRDRHSIRRCTFNFQVVLHSHSTCIWPIAYYLVNIWLRKYALGRLWTIEQETGCLCWEFHLAFDEFVNGEWNPHSFWLDLLSPNSRPDHSRQRLVRSAVLGIFLLLFGLSILSVKAAGQSSATSSTENEAWLEGDLHMQMQSNWRVLSFIGLEQAAGYPFQQWYVAAGLGRQFRAMQRSHLQNIDPDKEHYLLLAGGYEYLRTTQSGDVKDENRLTFDMTPNLRPAPRLLLRDRNWVELRWINGAYSTTYRNMVVAEVDFSVNGIRFTPFGTVEFFYDSPKHAWDQEWYTGGVQFPYKRAFMLETYYRREHCATCAPQNWNVGGATLNFFFNNVK